MNEILENLFYSKKDDVLFWTAGDMPDEDGNASNMIVALDIAATKFTEFCKCKYDKIRYQKITTSRTYKNTFIFFFEKPEHIPAQAFRIKTTMSLWILNH